MQPRDDDMQAVRECPACGDTDVPHLIVRLGSLDASGLSWRCRSCNQEWSDLPVLKPILKKPQHVPALEEHPGI